MKLIDKLDRLVSKFAVRDLMKYVMLGSFLVFLVVMAVQVTRIRRGAGQALPVD